MKRFMNMLIKNKVVSFLTTMFVFLAIFLGIYFYNLKVENNTTPNYIYSQF